MFDLASIEMYLFKQLSFIITPSHGLYFCYLLSAFFIAILYGLFKKKTLNPVKSVKYIFSIHVKGNVSFFDDCKLFVFDKLILGFMYAFLFSIAFFLKEKTSVFMVSIDAFNHDHSIGFISMAFYSLGAILVFDFSTFIEHYMSHKFRFLWEFHKVHHIPKHLNPITAYRSHPINQGLFVLISGSLLGVYSGVVSSFFSGENLTIIFAGQNVFMFILLVFGLNLQHSHIQIIYPRFIRDILVSPAYHQLHHSSNPEHYDKNFGFIFSFWDRLFRTQLHLNNNKKLKFGVKDSDYSEYSGLFNHYFTPVKKVFKYYRSKIGSSSLKHQ